MHASEDATSCPQHRNERLTNGTLSRPDEPSGCSGLAVATAKSCPLPEPEPLTSLARAPHVSNFDESCARARHVHFVCSHQAKSSFTGYKKPEKGLTELKLKIIPILGQVALYIPHQPAVDRVWNPSIVYCLLDTEASGTGRKAHCHQEDICFHVWICMYACFKHCQGYSVPVTSSAGRKAHCLRINMVSMILNTVTITYVTTHPLLGAQLRQLFQDCHPATNALSNAAEFCARASIIFILFAATKPNITHRIQETRKRARPS